MRILHVHSGNMYGGVETLLSTLARYRGEAPEMQPAFALCAEGRLSQELREAGAEVHILGMVRLRNPLSALRARRALLRAIGLSAPDVVVTHSAWSQTIFGPVVRALGLPLGMWIHDVLDGKHWLQRLARRVRPDFAICNSEFTRSSLATVYPGVRSELLRYPIAPRVPVPDRLGERARTRASLGVADDAVVIIQVSRLEPYKGHTLLLEALGALRGTGRWECWQVGGVQHPDEGAYLQRLRDQAERLGIADRVRFLGQRSDVRRLLDAADIHCQPNLGPEPFGITFVEALAAGLPVVTTAIGGALEIVDERCGVLTPEGDAAALAAALGRLIAEKETRARLGAAGPDRAHELADPATQLERLGALFSRVTLDSDP